MHGLGIHDLALAAKLRGCLHIAVHSHIAQINTACGKLQYTLLSDRTYICDEIDKHR